MKIKSVKLNLILKKEASVYSEARVLTNQRLVACLLPT